MADLNRQYWNKQQKELKTLLSQKDAFEDAIKLCLNQHAMTHSSSISGGELLSFDDIFWEGMDELTFRRTPKKSIYSIAWHYYHMSRIEDMTMNTLIAGRPQIFYTNEYQQRMSATACDTGNAMSGEEIQLLSSTIDIKELRFYRIEVGKSTSKLIRELGEQDLKKRIDSLRLQQLLDDGSVVAAAKGLTDYWANRTVAGLLLMPATRHNFVHLNEAGRVKGK